MVPSYIFDPFPCHKVRVILQLFDAMCGDVIFVVNISIFEGKNCVS